MRGGNGLVLTLGVVAVVATGCAPFGRWSPVPPGAGSVDRPTAPPEYDVLVAQLFEAEGALAEASAAYGRALFKDPDSAFLVKKLAELAARQNQLERAIAHGERALALDPDDVGTRVFLGTLYRISDQVDRASQVLRGESGDPVSKEAALILYGMLLDAGRFRDSLEVAQWIRVQAPRSMRGAFAVAAALQKLGRGIEAETTLREALEHQSGNISIYHAIARLRRERGDQDGEIEVYREVLEANPDHPATLTALVDALVAEERIDDAIEVLAEAQRRAPDDLRASIRLGFLYFEQRNYQAARPLFERALRSNAAQGDVAYFLGIVRKRTRDSDGALAAFRGIRPEDDRYADARIQIAEILEGRGELANAIREVELAQARRPSREVDLYLASLRAKSGDLDGAVAFLEELLASFPEDAEVLYSLGVIYGEAQRTEEALRYMDLALGKNGEHAGALNYVGYTWAEQGQNLEEAEAYINRALAMRPEDGFITDSLGWVYYMRGQGLLKAGRIQDGRVFLERALSKLGRASELTGGDPVIAEHLGDVYRLLDRKPEALEHYKKAIELGPREREQPNLRGKYELLQQELHSR